MEKATANIHCGTLIPSPTPKSGCFDSVKMSASVNLLQERYRLNSMFLGREMEGVLSEGILALRVGDYRTKVMEQNDETINLLLNKALELDKCSSQYLACLPPHSRTSFTSAEFTEAVK